MPQEKPLITLERLRSVLHFDSTNGIFTWKVDISRKVKAGTVAGHLTPRGYVFIVIDGKSYKAHRLAWFHHHGVWPDGDLDHRNGIKSANWIDNLRPASPAVNHQNLRSASARSATGLLGVVPHREKWQAHITIDNKTVSLGTFDSPEDAHAAYLVAKRRHHEGCTI